MRRGIERGKGALDRENRMVPPISIPHPHLSPLHDRALHAAWRRHHAEEPELALQVLVALERLLHHGETRAALLAEPAVMEDVAAAVGHGHAAVRATARACVALLIEADRQDAEESTFGGGESGIRINFLGLVLLALMLCEMHTHAHNTHRAVRAALRPPVRGAQRGVAGCDGGGRRVGWDGGSPRRIVGLGRRSNKSMKMG